MSLALKEAQKALKKGNVPVGCIIIKNNKIIAKAHNQEFWHAEILCIQKAQKHLGKFLNNTSIFCTLKPCPMCEYAINLARIKTIIYGTKAKNKINFKNEFIGLKEERCYNILQKFFKYKRKL